MEWCCFLLHVRWVCMLAVLVAYNIGTCTSTDQRCNSRPEEKAYRPPSPKSTIAPKLKPWNISCVKGRQNKKSVRWMFCRMCRKVPEKSCIKEALQHSCSVFCQVVMCVSSCTCCVWQNVWKHHRSVRVVAFSLFWLLSGGDREYGCFEHGVHFVHFMQPSLHMVQGAFICYVLPSLPES